MLACVSPQFSLNLSKKKKGKKKKGKKKEEEPAPEPEPEPAEPAAAAKAAQEARLAKLGAPGVAEDGLAIQDLATLNVDELHPLSPEASARPSPSRQIFLGLTVMRMVCPGD